MRLQQGRLEIPSGMDIISFLHVDGKPLVQLDTSRSTPTLRLSGIDTSTRIVANFQLVPILGGSSWRIIARRSAP